MRYVILGGGLSAISTAFFLQDRDDVEEILILEKEDVPGGLCRSIKKGKYIYDIGPHILFSKDKEMLSLMLEVLEEKSTLRRSNQIIYKGRYVQYPFENDLSKLPKEDLDYCVAHFASNPYENYEAENMLQFFLKTFGEGITNTYLRPYNEKIWKYDPGFMDTQMVDRIPKPTHEEIMRSAAGETVDGYVHQLYFSYPSSGGIEAVVQGFIKKLGMKCRISCGRQITSVGKMLGGFQIIADGEQIRADRVISTIPVQELTRVMDVPEEIEQHVSDLRYNSILIAFVRTKEDLCGDHFAFMNPEKDIIFHRISKMDFLGQNYQAESGATYMVEVTYREKDYIDSLTEEELKRKIAQGMKRIAFVEDETDVEFINVTRHPYAYVIYDINHRKNMKAIRSYYASQGILLNGRFGNFEYWNMDRVIRESKKLVEEKI
ncbi:MAG: NAD(P)-binding protein [Lachnospiraceae bacterium]|jgi:protoporphyrinogen oxidase|nr:NAD(P)-binding protein [Lachnospiraceae bacterium]